MAVFSSIALAIGRYVATLTVKAFFTAVAKFVGTIIVSSMVSRVLAKRAGQGNGGLGGGGRVQLAPATDNKLPVVYGNAFLGGPVTDAFLTTDQKTMYYVVSLCEKTTYGNITFDTGNIFYDGKLCTFSSDGLGGNTKVTQLITNTSPAQIDTKINGYLNIYLYNNGSANGFNTITAAYDVFPKWLGDANYAMSNTAFAIVQVKYNTDAGTTSLGALTAKVINTGNTETANSGRYLPGSAIYDYMVNDRYGCGLDANIVDSTNLLIDVNAYANANITYIDTSNANATQSRYLVNGPLDTSSTCLENLQILADSCDSWLQYSEKEGKWRVVLNAPYSGNVGNLFAVNSNNIVGGVQINPIDLNDTYNEVEVAYPNKNIKDQTDYQIVELQDTAANILLSPNEAINRLNLPLGVVNDAVQAKYLGVRRLLQSREDITIAFQTDFSGIQVEAGDVISVTHETYGWTDKLFRVLTVAEQTFEDNTLGTQMVAFEYNGTIYDDNSIQDFVPAYNTGLVDPNVFDIPIAPTIANGTNANAGTTYFTVTGTTPANGLTTYFDFNYGNSSNVSNHILYRTAQNGVGEAFAASANVEIPINDLAAGNYYFSVTARNDFAGRQSNASTVFDWPGPKVTTYDPNTNTGGIGGNNIQPNSISANMFITGLEPIEIVNTLATGCNANTVGKTVFYTVDNKLYTCNGTNFVAVAAANQIVGNITANQITNVFANTVFGNFTFANIPNANIIGQLVAGQLANASVTAGVIAANAVIAGDIAANAVLAGCIAADAVVANNIAANAIIAGKIAANAVTAGTIAAGVVTTDTMTANTINGDRITGGTIVAAKLSVSQLDAISAAMGTLTSGTVRTSSANNVPRVEISSSGNFPLWYGNNTKDAANAKFYVDTNGNAFFAGDLSAAGGTTSIDISAVTGGGGVNFMKGAQFVGCRDNVQVTFNQPYPANLANRVQVVFVGGGLTYTDDANIAGPQYQKFDAFNIDANGFLPSLRLSEQIGSGNVTYSNVNVAFTSNSNTVATKTTVAEAYDDVYSVILNEVRAYCDYGPFDFGDGNLYYYGILGIDVFANGTGGNFNIISDFVYLSTTNSPGNAFANGWSAAGVADGMGNNSTFTITSTLYYGANGTVNGNLVYWTEANVTANTVSATPNGVSDVTALVFVT